MNVIDLIDMKQPDKTVFSDEYSDVTYAEFEKYSKTIGTNIANRFFTTRRPIVVFVDRSVKSLCAMFGIVFSGNFYVPIDQDQPADRIVKMLEKIVPLACICLSEHSELDPRITDAYPILRYDELVTGEYDDSLLHHIQEGILDIDPLYAICTSGSTGSPKSVLISHRNVIDFIPVFIRTFGLSDREVYANQAPFDFDVSTKDIYSTLFCGATMHIIPKICFSMPKKLIDFLNGRKVTTIIWAVSAMCIPSGFNAFKYDVPHFLKNAFFSGEQMPMKQLNIWRKFLPEVRYVNLYGPTEITCNCSYYIVDRMFEDTETLPIGRSFQNEALMVLREDGSPVGEEETGEICVRGTCLALGYYNDPEKTAQAFRQTPEHHGYPELIYHTGDLAVMDRNGEYRFVGRKDFQIKHMGHRIELGEIETLTAAMEGIGRVCSFFDEDRGKIVLYYDGKPEKMETIGYLKRKLPKYMIPNIIYKVDELPLNKNGKIDRQQIRRMYMEK